MVIWEVSEYAPGVQPTAGQRRAAADLVERSERAAHKKGWEDIEQGLADGFSMIPGDGTHYFNEEFIMDDRVLDPERPEFLMYYNTPKGRRLVGYMYRVRDLGDRGPQIGGPLTVWHYHVWDHVACLRPNKLPTGQPAHRGRCQQGLVPSHRSPEMVHVWFIDRPQGPFATDMAIDPAEAVKQLEKRDRERRPS
jgi:hypothetical protein